MIGIDLPEGIYHKRVTVQVEDLFLSPANRELAAVLNVLGICKIQSSEAGFGQVCQEDIPPFAKVGFPQFVASLKLGEGDNLVRLRVSKCDHVVNADFRCDRNVAEEVEMDRKREKFTQGHQIVWSHKWFMEHQNESVVLRLVDV